MEMAGFPADIGDWSVVRVFSEGSRLLKKHFGDFLPIFLLFIFPASLIKVLHSQFRVADFVGPQGSTDPEPKSFWALLLLGLSLDLVPQLLFVFGYMVMFQVLKDKIYGNDYETRRDSESFLTTVNLAFKFSTSKKDQTETSALLKEQMHTAYKRKILRALAAIAVCYFIFIVISTSGVNFTPEAIAAMRLPPWTIFLFTLLIAVTTALITTYLLLVALVLCIWVWLPATPILALNPVV